MDSPLVGGPVNKGDMVPEIQNDAQESVNELPAVLQDGPALVASENEDLVAVLEVQIPDVVRRMRAPATSAAGASPARAEVFAEVAAAWAAGRLPHQRRRRARPADGTTGIGITIELNDALAFAIVTNALGQMLGEAALATWRSRRSVSVRFFRRRGRHRLSPDAVPQPEGSSCGMCASPNCGRSSVTKRLRRGVPALEATVLAEAAVVALLAPRAR